MTTQPSLPTRTPRQVGRGPLLALLVLFAAAAGPTMAQDAPLTIRGTVTDAESSQPLPGVNVLVKGTSRGTASAGDGTYELRAAAADTLVFRFIGYVTQEVAVDGRTTIDVALEEDSGLLNEVVVIGYGTQERGDLTGAVSSVNVENLERLPGAVTSNLLQGQVAGVSATIGSGQPGQSAVVDIRGVGTLGDNEPLYIIDGVPGDIDDVNPTDIASIDVLKDASSAAIYGSRAANGVIIITTRRGAPDGLRVTLNTYAGVQSLGNRIDLANRAEYDQITRQMFENAGVEPPAYVLGGDYADTDWQDEFFSPGPEQKYDLSIAGGTEDLSFYVSGGYFDQEGIALGTGHERVNLRVNSDVTKGRFTFGESLGLSRSNTDYLTFEGAGGGYGILYEMANMLPHTPVRNEDNPGGFANPPHPQMPQSTNPVGLESLVTSVDEVDELQANVYGKVELIEGLTFEQRLGADVNEYYGNYFAPVYFMGPQVQNLTNNVSNTRSRFTHTTWNSLLSYDGLTGLHKYSALLGYSQERELFESTGANVENTPSDVLRTLGAGTENPGVFGSKRETALRSQFGRLTYAYASRYLLTLNVRRDGSSRFAADNQYGVFPSVGVGWRVSSEPFFSLDAVSNLKVRANWGRLGNQEIGDYLFSPTITTNTNALNYVFGDEVYIGGLVTAFASPDIRWETTTSFGVGLDLGLLGDALTLTADYYDNETTDMLVFVPIPSSTGAGSPLTNGGALATQGVEVALQFRDREGAFTYDVTATAATSRNRVTQLGFEGETFTGGFVEYGTHPTTRTEVGREVAGFYLYQTDGLFQSQAEVDAHVGTDGALLQPNAAPGDVRFADANGDGVLDDDDKVYFGSAAPDLEYGLTFNASYGAFDVSTFVQGTLGNQMYNAMKFLTHRTDRNINHAAELVDAWTPENTDTDIPRNISGDPNNNARPSDRFLEDASYLRLRNLQLGYRVPERLAATAGVASLRVYASAENLLTVTGYSGFDPAVTNFSLFRRGVDSGLYPPSRKVLVGLQARF